MELTSLPVLMVDLVLFSAGLGLLIVGLWRAARAEGVPVTLRRLFRPPATLWGPVGLVWVILVGIWIVLTVIGPAFVTPA